MDQLRGRVAEADHRAATIGTSHLHAIGHYELFVTQQVMQRIIRRRDQQPETVLRALR